MGIPRKKKKEIKKRIVKEAAAKGIKLNPKKIRLKDYGYDLPEAIDSILLT